MSSAERRRSKRVTFERSLDCRMMAIDGTWARDCVVIDASNGGAKLRVEGSVRGLPLSEFFLSLSANGLAYRRCKLSWVDGEYLGVEFINTGRGKKTSKSSRDRVHV